MTRPSAYLSRALAAYRRTGADLPYGDPRRAHGVAMEGYFWRVTDRDRGRSLIALIGVNRGPRGPWATLGLAAWPDPALTVTAPPNVFVPPSVTSGAPGAAC